MTPLAERLVARIRLNGPISIADYMVACLGDPDYGYYMRREPFGRGGDFVTAPEVSQMFGELLGAWCLATWQAMGSPAPFVLAELGPGRGTLMADILRTARILPGFIAAARVHLIEMSPRLRDAQRTSLTESAERLAWVDGVENLPAAPLLLIANEFFDALPIHQFVRTPDGWSERMVGLGEDGGLAFGLMPISAPPTGLVKRPAPDLSPASKRGLLAHETGEERLGLRLARGRSRDEPPEVEGGQSARAGQTALVPLAEEGPGDESTPKLSVMEVSPARGAVMQSIAERMTREGGAALVIDYGYEVPAIGDTLQAVRRHEYTNPLAEPGEADLTAHVDLTALGNVARAAGAHPRSVISQGALLRRLGLGQRATVLSRGKTDATRTAIASAVERLAGASGMGELFKVLAISSLGLALPAFDDMSDE